MREREGQTDTLLSRAMSWGNDKDALCASRKFVQFRAHQFSFDLFRAKRGGFPYFVVRRASGIRFVGLYFFFGAQKQKPVVNCILIRIENRNTDIIYI